MMNAEELRSLQAPLKERYRERGDEALITLRAQGRAGEGVTRPTSTCAAKEVPVAFRDIRLHCDLDTDASDTQLDQLLRLTERYCVVYQTLARPPRIAVGGRPKRA